MPRRRRLKMGEDRYDIAEFVELLVDRPETDRDRWTAAIIFRGLDGLC